MHVRARGMFRLTATSLSLFAVVGGSVLACGASGSGTSFSASDSGTVSEGDASSTAPSPDAAVADADASSEPSLLATAPNCPLSLFAPGTDAVDFSSDASISASWLPNYAVPVPAAGSLRFGPHPMNENWWENYSPITSRAEPGDVLVCARLRISPDADADAGAGVDGGSVDGGGDSSGAESNSFEVTVRLPDDGGFETAGMALQILANASVARLHTRTGTDSWIVHASAPFTVSKTAPSTVDLALYAHDKHFFAEVRNVDTGDVVTLRATYELPSGGAVNLLGWRERASTFVDRLVIGAPASSVVPALE